MATVTPQADALFTKLRAWVLESVLPLVPEVVQGLGNRVPMPVTADGIIYLTPTLQKRLATNIHTYVDTFDPDPPPDPPPVIATESIEMKTEFQVQIDCYGANAQALATILQTLLRDARGCEGLAPEMQPLYADDAQQMPLVSGEEQYLERWLVPAVLQYNPVVTLAQQFAGAAAAGLINVDVEYPP